MIEGFETCRSSSMKNICMRSDKVTPNKIRDMVRDRLLLQLRSRGKSIYLQSTGISTDAGWIAQVEVTVSSFHFFFGLLIDVMMAAMEYDSGKRRFRQKACSHAWHLLF